MSNNISKYKNNRNFHYNLKMHNFLHNKNFRNLTKNQFSLCVKDSLKNNISKSFEAKKKLNNFQGCFRPIKKSIHIFIPDKNASENDLNSTTFKSFQNNAYTPISQNNDKTMVIIDKSLLGKRKILKKYDKVQTRDNLENNFLYKLSKVSFIEKRIENDCSGLFQIKKYPARTTSKSTNSIILK